MNQVADDPDGRLQNAKGHKLPLLRLGVSVETLRKAGRSFHVGQRPIFLKSDDLQRALSEHFSLVVDRRSLASFILRTGEVDSDWRPAV